MTAFILLPLSAGHRYGLSGGPPHSAAAAPRLPSAAVLGDVAGVLPAAVGAAAPSAVYNWTASTSLKGGAKRGAVMLLLHDCVGIAAGRRLRINTGTDAEEEGVVATMACPSPGLGPENPRDATGAAVGGRPRLGGSALLPGGASVELRAQQQQQASGVTLPHTPVTGVVQLAFALLHDHDEGASIMQYPAVKPPPPLCLGEPACSGHGACNEASGECACNAGRNGTACELQTCEDDCSGRGTCHNGTCACLAGWAAPSCATPACAADCSGRGTCRADGTCVCEPNWSGPSSAPCSVQGAGCPNGCSHHGRCIQGNCACHHDWVGPGCGQAVLNLLESCPAGCGGNGVCSGGRCACFTGFYGSNCTDFCPSNCSFHGYCSVAFDCVCHTGYGGPDCSVECPNRCSGHGDCEDGECHCFSGYEGPDCSTVTGITLGKVMTEGLRAELPLVLVVLVFLALLVVCFVVAHIRNLCSGKYGVAAIPLYDFFMKKWRNAPVYEPVYFAYPPAEKGGGDR